jgi:hypothetical protein
LNGSRQLLEFAWAEGWSVKVVSSMMMENYVGLAAVQWQEGRHKRVYFREEEGNVLEGLCWEGGKWVPGKKIA